MVARSSPADTSFMTSTTSSATSAGPLRRSRDQRIVAGVAAGLAEHFGLDLTIVRVGIVALSLLGGAGVPLYLAAWLLMPEEGSQASVADDLLDHLGLR